ncbi:hypothetical protein [Devosia sp. SL43]|uniref:hypothetical protein n=1 Tax=Devosia sp. SL43 TaxID=2806348 RepID=UPI001F2FDA8F|nr:hypothetical protein [Devosia sp. SL43]UJW85419.1 hypothetical protein IM737_18800 [Devosia sp. SL43]
MRVNVTRAILTAVSILGASVPALAAPADCEALAEAYGKLGTVPAFRQQVEQDGTKLETIAVGDNLYMNMDGEWTALPLSPGGRAAMFEGTFDILLIKECSVSGEEMLNGKAMVVYDYVLPPIEGLSTEPMPQKVWVGKDDGLPYLVTNPTGQSIVSYEGVEAPL